MGIIFRFCSEQGFELELMLWAFVYEFKHSILIIVYPWCCCKWLFLYLLGSASCLGTWLLRCLALLMLRLPLKIYFLSRTHANQIMWSSKKILKVSAGNLCAIYAHTYTCSLFGFTKFFFRADSDFFYVTCLWLRLQGMTHFLISLSFYYRGFYFLSRQMWVF